MDLARDSGKDSGAPPLRKRGVRGGPGLEAAFSEAGISGPSRRQLRVSGVYRAGGRSAGALRHLLRPRRISAPAPSQHLDLARLAGTLPRPRLRRRFSIPQETQALGSVLQVCAVAVGPA